MRAVVWDKLSSAENMDLVTVKDQIQVEIAPASLAEVCVVSEVDHPLEFGCTQPVKKHTHVSYKTCRKNLMNALGVPEGGVHLNNFPWMASATGTRL